MSRVRRAPRLFASLLAVLLAHAGSGASSAQDPVPPPAPPPEERRVSGTGASPLPEPVRPPVPRTASSTVPPDDPIYRDLERLDALGLLPDEVLGQRPMSEGEIARLLRRASQLPGAVRRPARDLLVRLRRRFPDLEHRAAQGFESIELGGAWRDDRVEPFPENNQVGQIDARKEPLTADRGGRPYVPDGGTFWFRSRHTIPTRSNLVFTAAPEFRYGVFDDGGRLRGDGDFQFQALNGRLRLGPAVLQVGRDALAFGPVRSGGFMMSTNARPLDMVLVTSESPFRLPWIFRHAGRTRWLAAYTPLGDDRRLPGSALLLLRASFRPHRLVEAGFSNTLVMLGDGAPKGTVLDYLWEIVPINRTGVDRDFTDHRYGFDLRLHAWPGRVTLYNELLIEDAREGFWEDVVARRFGLHLPALGPGGEWEMTAEYLRLPAILYRHGRWTTGYALDGRLLGNELGPDSRGALLRLGRVDRAGNRVGLELAWDARDADLWAQVPVPETGSYDDIFRVVDNPTEHRWRARLEIDREVSRTVRWQPRMALERVTNPGYDDTAEARTNVLLELVLRYGFDR
jgi:hypothetical protein